MEPFSNPGSGDALPKRPYQNLPEAFRQRHCISIDMTKFIPNDRCGPAQALAKAVIAQASEIYSRGNSMTIRWTPSHTGVEGNDQADIAAKLAAANRQSMI